MGLGEAEPLHMRYQAGPRREIEGLLVGLGEAEPLHMRYQAEPGNEGFKLSHDRNNAVKIKILILLYKLLVNPQKFAASVLHPHQATKTRIFCF